VFGLHDGTRADHFPPARVIEPEAGISTHYSATD
jgi:hypothetical protein